MANRESAVIEITPEVLLKAYACGIFPMAESAEDPALYWIEPEMRGIIPLDRFHVPARLARTVRADRFTVTVNRDFDGVLDGCAEPRPGRPRTWINARIRRSIASSTSAAIATASRSTTATNLVGGLYGVTLGRAFFGESMFHRARDASKIALVHLVARLKAGGFKLLDTQFVTDHLKIFGADRGAAAAISQAAGSGARRRRRLRRARPEASGDRSGSARAAFSGLMLRPDWPLRRRGMVRLRRGVAARGVVAPAWQLPGPASVPASGCGHHRHFRALTVGQPDVVDRVLDPVQARARANIQPVKMRLISPCKRHLVDLDEGIGVGRLGRRAGVADARRHLQRAELHGLADRRRRN